jgi:hypothetical protein
MDRIKIFKLIKVRKFLMRTLIKTEKVKFNLKTMINQKRFNAERKSSWNKLKSYI